MKIRLPMLCSDVQVILNLFISATNPVTQMPEKLASAVESVALATIKSMDLITQGFLKIKYVKR